MLVACGCSTGPLQDNPFNVRTEMPLATENPVYIDLGHREEDYALVFEKVLDVVSDFFPIGFAVRDAGRIETRPVMAPGLGEPWRPGSPDFYQRTLAFFQSIRHRAIVTIKVADNSGYFVEVKVLKELEDVPNMPRTSTPGGNAYSTSPGGATFRKPAPLQPDLNLIEGRANAPGWIPQGRDPVLEHRMLVALRRAFARTAKSRVFDPPAAEQGPPPG